MKKNFVLVVQKDLNAKRAQLQNASASVFSLRMKKEHDKITG
jgi:hypothetical protein